MNGDDARRKIRSLLALADPKNNATTHERETAKRLADKLMAEHEVTAEAPKRLMTIDELREAFKAKVYAARTDAELDEVVKMQKAALRRRVREQLFANTQFNFGSPIHPGIFS